MRTNWDAGNISLRAEVTNASGTVLGYSNFVTVRSRRVGGYGIGVGVPWPGTTFLLPANGGTTAEEAAFDFNRTTGNPPYFIPNSSIGNNARPGNFVRAGRLFRAGGDYWRYLEYYVALQWTIVEQPGTAPVRWAYMIDEHDDGTIRPRMVRVARSDDPSRAVYVSVIEGGPGRDEGGPLRNSGLSPAAMRALGFPYTITTAQQHGDFGWLTYEWAPGAPPGPAN